MPPLERPTEMPIFHLPPRRASLIAETEVLVVGGGPSGLGAALGAAQAGAKVILAERYGFLGGNATAALVMPLMSFHTQNFMREAKGSTTLLPADHGYGDAVIAGVLEKFLDRLIKAGGAVVPSMQTGYVVPFDPEIFKLAALEMLDEAGVHFLLHAFASDILLENNQVQGVVFETKSGTVVIKAQVVIDATGDGDIAFHAGVPYDIGREEDGLVQPMTLMFRLAEFERNGFENYVKTNPEEWHGVHGLWELIRKATDAGELDLPREDILFFGTPHEREISVNSTRVPKVLGTDVWNLTYAEWISRRQMKQIAGFLKRHVPGFEKSYVVQSGVHVGVRETRRIRGEYSLTSDDILKAREFDDVIARSSYPIDIHNPKGPGTYFKRLPPGEAYDIPLRCLIPQKVEGLLVSGRCMSGTHEAHSSYRIMPVSMATGQAAGVCGALAVKERKPPREVPYSQVQKELIHQGANLREINDRFTEFRKSKSL